MGYMRKLFSFDKIKLRTRNLLDFFYKHVERPNRLYFLYRLQLCNFRTLLINKYFILNEKKILINVNLCQKHMKSPHTFI